MERERVEGGEVEEEGGKGARGEGKDGGRGRE